jgi:hypothetical protein
VAEGVGVGELGAAATVPDDPDAARPDLVEPALAVAVGEVAVTEDVALVAAPVVAAPVVVVVPVPLVAIAPPEPVLPLLVPVGVVTCATAGAASTRPRSNAS